MKCGCKPETRVSVSRSGIEKSYTGDIDFCPLHVTAERMLAFIKNTTYQYKRSEAIARQLVYLAEGRHE